MASDAQPVRIEELLDHAAWLRRLALHLAGGRADLADDAVQDAWVVALERQHESRRSPRHWLAQVLRNALHQRARSDAARRERERATARAEALDSAATTVERTQTLRVLVDELLALDEPYLSTLLLRFQDGLSAEEIARAQNVSASTVRNRMSRGLALLRERLERRGRSSLPLVLAPLLSRARDPLAIAAAPVATTSAAVISTFIMSKFVVSSAAALALAALVWWAWPEGAAVQPVALAPTATKPELELAHSGENPLEDASRVPLGGIETQSAPAASAPSTTPRTAALEVHVTRAADGTPAEGVRVSVSPAEGLDVYFPRNASACDARGIARFEDLEPGKFSVVHDRGDGVWVVLAAGDEKRLEFRIPVGVEVVGSVVDEGERGVANARIWLSAYGNLGEGWEVATSDAAGHFRVIDVGEARMVAARANGREPSLQYHVPGHPGEKVELTLRIPGPGGAIEGIARAPGGGPAARARIVIGRGPYSVRGPDGSRVASPPPYRIRTDDEGRFRVDGIAPGTVPVEARMDDLAPWNALAEIVAGHTTITAIDLEPGATVEGSVRDSEGQPAADVTIASGPYGQFASSSTTSAKDGTFRLSGLAPGDANLVASAGSRGTATTKRFIAPGATARWEAQLELEGGSVGGRLVDDAGRPLAAWSVGAVALDQPALHYRSTVSDSEGRFLIANWPKQAQALDVREQFRWTGPAALLVREAPIGSTDLELVVPRSAMASAHVIGRVLGPDGKPVPGALLNWKQPGDAMTFREEAKVGTGEFHVGPQPAGRYRFDASAPGFGATPIGERDLAPGETLDLGTIALEAPGRLHVVLEPEDGIELESSTHCTVDDEAGGWSLSLEIDDGEGLSQPLAPGNYVVRFAGSSTRAIPVRVEVRSNENAQARLRVERGTWRVVSVRWKPGARASHDVEADVVDASGALVCRARGFSTSEGEIRLWASGLVLGAYHVSVRAPDGRTAAGSFDVVSLDPPEDDAESALELWLR